MSPFSDGDTSDTTPEDSENDNALDEDANEELEEPEVAEHVRSKVDEMMRNLQGLSQNNDDPEGFDAIADNDDLDMFDVYEERLRVGGLLEYLCPRLNGHVLESAISPEHSVVEFLWFWVLAR